MAPIEMFLAKFFGIIQEKRKVGLSADLKMYFLPEKQSFASLQQYREDMKDFFRTFFVKYQDPDSDHVSMGRLAGLHKKYIVT